MSIKKIAEKVGVSPATVFRVLNNPNYRCATPGLRDNSTEDITDHAIDFIFQHTNSFPDKPFFLYLAYGAVHAPHHAPKKYMDKYKGKFDEGWDEIRKKLFANQKKLGIIPESAELTESAPFVEAWDDLDEKRKKLYARYMEVFAGTLEYTDAQIGRFIEYLNSIEQLDNTLIVLLSDNGASAEGGREGRVNRYTGINITELDNEAEYGFEHIEELGGEYSFCQYPTGWANALNTPFQWYKTWTHEGGVKDPLILRYPKLIKDQNGVRNQYVHVSDVTPTVLDILGLKKPDFIKGVANHAFTDDYRKDIWELYHVDEDYSEKYDVSEQYPEKLKELQEEFFIEAGRNNVFPLLLGSIHADPYKHKSFFGDIPIPESERVFKNIFKPYTLTERPGVNIDNASHFISVDIRRKGKEEGVLFSAGDHFGGFVFYIKDNKLKYAYNANRINYYTAETEELPRGEINVRFDFDYHGKAGGDVVLSVNGKEAAKVHIGRICFQRGDESAFIRANFYTEVVPNYEVPFEFTGDILKLTIHTFPSKLSQKDELEKAKAAE